MTAWVVRDVEVDGLRTDVRWNAGTITEVAPGLAASGDERVLDGRGAALLPGLHDHHLHLPALAAARSSVDCSASPQALSSASGSGWIRGVGAHVSLDRHALDRIVADRPVRLQHHSGALWMLNSVALRAVAHVLDDSADVERDADGAPTGRLWRYDERLRPALDTAELDFAGLGAELASYGITSVTEATPDLTALPGGARITQRVTFLGRRKLHLRDHDLPTYDELRAEVLRRRAEGLSVAVHCVTRESLLLTLAVLHDVGIVDGDRIEHASVVPDPELIAALSPLRVVTQPGFVTAHEQRYRRDVDPDDLPHLYRHASLIDAGVAVTASSDAPHGPVDPWQIVHAAATRRLGPAERVPAEEALAGYLTDSTFRPRAIAPGAQADLVLLHCSHQEALDAGSAEVVRATFIGGARVHG